MFLHVCVILFTGGGVLSQHSLQVVSQHALQQGGVSSLGVSPPRGAGVSPLGVVGWPSVIAFCCGLLLWPSGMVFGGCRRHHTRRPPHQKATTPEGHNTRRGVPGGDPPPGPHPGGKLRGIRPRPTPKGEIQGDQVQANIQVGNSGGSGPDPPPPTTTAAGGTYPTGMHSCF